MSFNKKRILEYITKDSSLNAVKVFATAMTAITIAIIASKLTTLINSLILTGLISIISALTAEFYRITLTASADTAKKILKAGKATPTRSKQSVNDGLTEENQEPIQSRTQVTDTVSAQSRDDSFFKKRPYFIFLIIFLTMSISTIGASYEIAKNTEKTETINSYTTVQENIKKDLTEKEKNELITKAVMQADNLSTEKQEIALEQINELIESRAKHEQSINELTTQIEEKDEEINTLEEKVNELTTIVNDLTIVIENLSDRARDDEMNTTENTETQNDTPNVAQPTEDENITP